MARQREELGHRYKGRGGLAVGKEEAGATGGESYSVADEYAVGEGKVTTWPEKACTERGSRGAFTLIWGYFTLLAVK